jgi:hypothetical protein
MQNDLTVIVTFPDDLHFLFTLDVDLPMSLLSGYMKRLSYVGCRTSSQ